MKPQYQWMDTHFRRMLGAQFRENLGGKVFVFHFHHSAKRLFHTMFCPPIRIVVLNTNKTNHEVLYDQVIQPWQFIHLPAGNLILEMDPDTDYRYVLPDIFETLHSVQKIDSRLLVGGTDSNVSVVQLLFALFTESLRDLRSVKNTCLNERGLLDPDKLVKRYAPWQRGQILASAGFVLDFSGETDWLIPRGAIPLSADVLKYEKQYADELLAASHAAAPAWRDTLLPTCLGCGKGGSWRTVIAGDHNLPAEKSWRLLRPENNIPLCSCCAKRFKLSKNPDVLYNLARSFWGTRFEALNRWYLAEVKGGKDIPSDWDRNAYPLWPKSFGGNTWETGSGALQHVAPCWPRHVKRTNEHVTYLKKAGIYDRLLQYQFAD
jgi:hypothetical protein